VSVLIPDAAGAGGLDPAAPPEVAARVEGRTPLQLGWARLRRDKVAMCSLGFVVLLVLVAIFAPELSHLIGQTLKGQDRGPHGLTADGLPVGPSTHHWLGTDDLGGDVLARTMYGARISLFVGLVATLIEVVIGLVVGTVAGYFGGAIDTFLARFMDVVLSFPFLLTALALVARFHNHLYLTIGVIAFFAWSQVGRIVRGQIIALREREFIEAARSLGASNLRIMFIDLMPNLIAPVIVYGTLLIPVNIVSEATLSFLGLGVQYPTASWGQMISEASGQGLYQVAWWFLVVPGLALLLTTLAFNLLGDGLRDALDPRSERTMAK
jgi:peptide/nickel transport system permease protein